MKGLTKRFTENMLGPDLKSKHASKLKNLCSKTGVKDFKWRFEILQCKTLEGVGWEQWGWWVEWYEWGGGI